MQIRRALFALALVVFAAAAVTSHAATADDFDCNKKTVVTYHPGPIFGTYPDSDYFKHNHPDCQDCLRSSSTVCRAGPFSRGMRSKLPIYTVLFGIICVLLETFIS